MQHLQTCAKPQVGSKALAASKITINSPRTTHDWLRLPSIPGRNHLRHKISREPERQGFRVTIGNSGYNSIFSGLRSFRVAYSICGGDDAIARARCEHFTEHLCQTLDKCPILMPEEDVGKKLFNMTLVRLAAVSAFPDMKKLAFWPTFCLREVSNGAYWSARIAFIDTETNAPSIRRSQIRLSAFEGVDPSNIPDVTKLATFYRGAGQEIVKLENGRQVLPSDVDKRSNHSQIVHDTAQKFACWMSSILNDTITSPARLRETVRSYQKLVGCYDGRRKFSI